MKNIVPIIIGAGLVACIVCKNRRCQPRCCMPEKCCPILPPCRPCPRPLHCPCEVKRFFKSLC